MSGARTEEKKGLLEESPFPTSSSTTTTQAAATKNKKKKRTPQLKDIKSTPKNQILALKKKYGELQDAYYKDLAAKDEKLEQIQFYSDGLNRELIVLRNQIQTRPPSDPSAWNYLGVSLFSVGAIALCIGLFNLFSFPLLVIGLGTAGIWGAIALGIIGIGYGLYRGAITLYHMQTQNTLSPPPLPISTGSSSKLSSCLKKKEPENPNELTPSPPRCDLTPPSIPKKIRRTKSESNLTKQSTFKIKPLQSHYSDEDASQLPRKRMDKKVLEAS